MLERPKLSIWKKQEVQSESILRYFNELRTPIQYTFVTCAYHFVLLWPQFQFLESRTKTVPNDRKSDAFNDRKRYTHDKIKKFD